MKDIDKKIISTLYHEFRPTVQEISKRTKITRDRIAYSMNKMSKENVIKKFMTVYNLSAFDYNYFSIIFIKTNNKIENFLKANKSVFSFGKTYMDKNIRINLTTKSMAGIQEFLDDLYKGFEIIDHSLYILNENYMFPLKLIGDDLESAEIYEIIKDNKQKISVNDFKILKSLEENGRKRIVDISKETDLSCELIVQRIRELRKRGVLLGTKVLLNMEKLGLYYGVLFLQTDFKQKDKIIELCKKHPLIESLIFCFGEHNCIIQFFYSEEKDAREAIEEMRKAINPVRFNFVQLGEDEYLNTLPFV